MIDRACRVAVSVVALTLWGCGGGGSGGSGGGGSPPPVVTPSPDPVQPPSPPTNPTPTPSGAAIAGAVPGQTLFGSQACIEGAFSYAGSPSRLSGINTITRVVVTNGQPGNGVDIGYEGNDSYNVMLGFDYGGGFVRPTHKLAPQTSAFDYFNAGEGFEFEIYRNEGAQLLRNVTLGRYGTVEASNPSVPGQACFYAAGLTSIALPSSGALSYSGFGDGIAQIGGRTTRLFGSLATATIDFAQRTGTIRIDLTGREPAFGEIVGVSGTAIGSATAQLGLVPGTDYIADATLSGPGGAAGTISGRVFAGGAAVGFAYELRFPNGDRAFGSVAVQRP